jgi:hypothetical protein
MTTEEEDYKALLREQRREWERDQRNPWIKYMRVCTNANTGIREKGLNLEITKLWIEFLERELEKLEPFVGDDGDENAEDAFMLLSEVYIRLEEARQKRWARMNGQIVDKRRPGFFEPW